jgi:hypothetical protein
MITMKIPEQFLCEICDYNTSNKKDYNKHLSTAKHVNNASGYTKSPKKDYQCGVCNKKYKSRYGLWNHKKTCIYNDDVNENKKPENNTMPIDSSSNEIKVLTGLVVDLVKSNNDLQRDFQKQSLYLQKQNHDLQKQVLEICQKIQPSNTIINTNSHNDNRTFNLQFFLNEECKDAMNMSEFINSIQLKISDLENIGKVGYVEGISNIIIKELNETQLNKRPVHCCDVKRETLYVKEENKWEKDTDETKKMVRAVRDVNRKNYKMLANWKDTHPNCIDSDSIQSKEYTHLVSEVVMDNEETNVKKVIKKVAKQVIIEK